MRLPDWLIYLLVFIAIVSGVFRANEDADAPPAPPDVEGGAPLPAESPFDPEVYVEAGPAAPGTGTAFAVAPDGVWLSARHVVDGCGRVGIAVDEREAVAAQVTIARDADVAILRTQGGPDGLALDLEDADMTVGEPAFHIGFPQGRPGEVASRLMGRERLITTGRRQGEEPVLVWAEIGRTRGLRGSLGGLSGGPAFDARGQVVGVTIAEEPRRGKIYTAAPSAVARFIGRARLTPKGEPAEGIDARRYGRAGDELRRSLQVAQVICLP
jgi:serine protease Do